MTAQQHTPTQGAPDTARAAYRAELLQAADQYRAAGLTVIPVQGALARGRAAKAPAAGVTWQQFQTRRPSDSEHAALFAGEFGGLAILTGRKSGLIALDLDRPADYERLQALRPDLCDTYTVRTPRGGVHLYYALEPQLIGGPPIPGSHGDGIDLQADGQYILAPPTVLNKTAGVRYTVEHDRPVQLIGVRLPDLFGTAAQLRELYKRQAPTSAARVDPQPDQLDPAGPERRTIDRALVQHFNRHAPHGRNDSLYRTALQARRAGLDRDTAQALLSPHFLHATAPDRHARETDQQRARELHATVTSAYRAPRLPPDRLTARLETPTSAPDTAQHSRALPNAIREALLQRDQRLAPFIRFWELCAVQGLTGRDLTVQQLVSASGLSARAVRYALDRAAAAGVPMAPPAGISPAQPPVTPVNSDPDNCVIKSPKGRPAALHRLPTRRQLAHLCDLPAYSPADQLHSSALRTARTYRRGLHFALVARAQGRTFTRRWLGRRIGVTGRTTRRYETVQALDTAGELRRLPLVAPVTVTRSSPISSEADLYAGVYLHSEAGLPHGRGLYVNVTTPQGRHWRMRADQRRVQWYLQHRPAYRLELVELIGVRYTTAPPEPAALVEFDRQAALDRARFRDLQRGHAA